MVVREPALQGFFLTLSRGSSQPFVTQVPWDPILFSGFHEHNIHTVHKHTCRQSLIHIKGFGWVFFLMKNERGN